MFLILLVLFYAKILAPFNIVFLKKNCKQYHNDRNHKLTIMNYSCFITNMIKYVTSRNLYRYKLRKIIMTEIFIGIS